ncbi:ClpXP protease specificity-enhancing factor [Paucibacter sp. KCTC 42545]|uniref:ClpXP protease specificity-enhancing factor n=1 Tax=Paucibacter sp. KCTC 42545 TaxID=1768242 RepID=UPI000733A3DF|nr:ClpXP protease specificity-enhancing factor [Paucibacter sp. KCTC 42545]ALT78095.1 stringent starvation protein B [Paucibacter sp. KCTC 42545]
MDQSKGKGSNVDGTAATPSTSTRPYLIRALHDWCTDNGFTPYIAVHVDRFVQVPMEYVSNNEIVLNVGFEATSSLDLGNEFIQFKARFGGSAREIIVPVDHVVAIYARENGQGMAFPPPEVDGGGAAALTAAPASAAASPALEASIAATPDAAVPAKPVRGLRLAPNPVATEADAESTAPEASSSGSPDDEPDGPGPGAGRPALKRVK